MHLLLGILLGAIAGIVGWVVHSPILGWLFGYAFTSVAVGVIIAVGIFLYARGQIFSEDVHIASERGQTTLSGIVALATWGIGYFSIRIFHDSIIDSWFMSWILGWSLGGAVGGAIIDIIALVQRVSKGWKDRAASRNHTAIPGTESDTLLSALLKIQSQIGGIEARVAALEVHASTANSNKTQKPSKSRTSHRSR